MNTQQINNEHASVQEHFNLLQARPRPQQHSACRQNQKEGTELRMAEQCETAAMSLPSRQPIEISDGPLSPRRRDLSPVLKHDWASDLVPPKRTT